MLPLNAVALAGAVAFALASDVNGQAGRFCLATLAGYLVIVHSAVLLTGLAGHLSMGGLATVVTVVFLIATWLARFDFEPRRLERPERAAPFNAVALFPPLAATAAILAWLWPHLFEATRLWIWDDYTYHMVYPALWLREHAIAAVAPAQAFTMQAWYPLSASVVATWFMLPFPESRGDALAWVSLTGVLYGGIVAGGCVELLRRLQCRRHAWAVPVLLLATSPRIAIMASSF